MERETGGKNMTERRRKEREKGKLEIKGRWKGTKNKEMEEQVKGRGEIEEREEGRRNTKERK